MAFPSCKAGAIGTSLKETYIHNFHTFVRVRYCPINNASFLCLKKCNLNHDLTLKRSSLQAFRRPGSFQFLGRKFSERTKLKLNVSALWYPGRGRKLVAPVTNDITVLPDEASKALRGDEENVSEATLSVSIVSSMAAISPEDWNACALEAAGPGASNPFLAHAFLLSLEESGSAAKEEGWLPQHLVAKNSKGEVLGVVPLYLKSHSYGEYVFDHSWANAYLRYGESYYPKLQSCVPFTPATGPRILVRKGPLQHAVFTGLCQAMMKIANEFKVSSLHITFPLEEEWEALGSQGFLRRMGMQYHWLNKNYETFNDFLMDLKQGKRKNIRQERKKVVSQGLQMKRLRGDDIKPYHWDSFYTFYRNTTDQKWGQAYLTREFFHLLGERMGDDVLLVVAEDGGKVVAGALNLIGGDALYGRNWGSLPGVHYPALHFEACYYQAIEAAIEWGLQRVEAGAQGEHKIQRGYLPTPTYSAHYIRDDEFRPAIADFLRRETMQIEYTLKVLREETKPFKDAVTPELTL